MSTSFLIFGREPSLSFAEAYAYVSRADESIAAFGPDGVIVTDDSLVTTAPHVLGGIPKAGVVLDEAKTLSAPALAELLNAHVEPGRKFHFGLSSYSLGGRPLALRERKALGLSIKKILRERGHSVRLVESRSGNLSSVDVAKNGLLEKGVELCLLAQQSGYVIGKTESVQPFEEYSERDYGRPGRDMRRGMLPPKLAKIMVNLSGAKPGQTLLDPFCGAGTILSEALLAGIGVVGTDIDERAIRDSERNVAWLKEKHEIPDYTIKEMDVRTLDRVLASGSIDAVVTECDLGPPLTGRESLRGIQTIERELSDVYLAALDLIHFVLKPGSRAVLVWPYFKEHDMWVSAFEQIPGKGFTVVRPYPKQYETVYPLSSRGTLRYGREGQHVFREIVVLGKR